jgi:hypothetical protein
MIVRDNAERAALMHLVLEAARDCFHSLAAPQLREHVDSSYFDAHAEADASHADMGARLLAGEAPRTYQKLAPIVDQGWDMMLAIVERVKQLMDEAN